MSTEVDVAASLQQALPRFGALLERPLTEQIPSLNGTPRIAVV